MNLDNLIERISHEEQRWLVYFFMIGSIATAYRGISYLCLFMLMMALITVITIRSRSSNERIKRVFGYVMVLGAVSVALFHTMFLADGPAYALFNGLKTFMAGALPESAPIINTIFDTITFMLLVYFAIAMVMIISNIMNGQSFLTAIQTPAIIMIVVTVTEMFTTFLLGQ